MDSFEWNKIAGAVLSALLVIMAIREFVSEVYEPHIPEGRAYAIEVPETRVAEVAEEVASLAELLAGGDVAKGARVFARCKSCHTVAADAGSGQGPNLYNIVGAKVAAKGDFGYSGALKSADVVWDYEALDAWLAKPRAFIPGNKMAYAGLKKPEDRANVILYLRQFADAAPALPAFEAAPSEVEAVIEEAEATAEEAEAALEDAEGVLEDAGEAVEPIVESGPAETENPDQDAN